MWGKVSGHLKTIIDYAYFVLKKCWSITHSTQYFTFNYIWVGSPSIVNLANSLHKFLSWSQCALLFAKFDIKYYKCNNMQNGPRFSNLEISMCGFIHKEWKGKGWVILNPMRIDNIWVFHHLTSSNRVVKCETNKALMFEHVKEG